MQKTFAKYKEYTIDKKNRGKKTQKFFSNQLIIKI